MSVERKNIFWFILIRIIAVSSLLITAVIIQLSTSEFLPLIPFYYLALVSFALSLIYFFLYFFWKDYALQAHLQIFFDLLLITALVYISGGLSGSLSFLYMFSIIAASIVLSNRAAYITAAISAIFFGLLVDGMYLGIIPYFSMDQSRPLSLGFVLYQIFLAWCVFFLIAFLTNYLTGNLRKTKEALRLARKELEIKERLAVAGRVAAQVAHEVRNPLAAISGSVQVLKSELILNEEQKGLMDIVIKESDRVSQSIEQFLNLAAPAKGVFSHIDISEVLNDTLEMIERGGELDGRYCIKGNYKTLKIPFYGNSNQFKQIFWNLAKNALKSMPDGGNLTIDFVQDRKDKLLMRFTNTGKGMTEEEKERIFEPFYSGFEDGRGLGMTIVRRIIDDYEGHIQVNSELNKGTEIIISLPIKKQM